jgi:hypothetical protein
MAYRTEPPYALIAGVLGVFTACISFFSDGLSGILIPQSPQIALWLSVICAIALLACGHFLTRDLDRVVAIVLVVVTCLCAATIAAQASEAAPLASTDWQSVTQPHSRQDPSF